MVVLPVSIILAKNYPPAGPPVPPRQIVRMHAMVVPRVFLIQLEVETSASLHHHQPVIHLVQPVSNVLAIGKDVLSVLPVSAVFLQPVT